ncbi:hypothetical protein [Gluconobacter cerinus]|uniref:hypothetical protein n=1 Tax=Gluconobacter cerinus TaxID=38307 RepID=UPI001B8B5AD3|nr:hypothetical protein [Gluconobacter cerinus]MBS0984627.1 hypothetical protein [Gluconobacter cerinus]
MKSSLYKWWISYRYNKWLAHRGYKQWKPRINDDEYSIATMAKMSQDIFQEEIDEIINIANKKLIIKAIYLDDDEINAFASKLGKSNKYDLYIIALNKGIFSGINKYISGNEFESVLDKNFSSLKNIPKKDLYRISMWSISKSIMYHELAHILRGHLEFLIDEKIININDEYIEIKTNDKHSEKSNNIEKISKTEKIRLCENDADVHAARLFSANACTFTKKSNTEKQEEIYLGIYSLIIFSSHILFSIFDQTSYGNESRYPQPVIRSAIYASQFSVEYSKNFPEIEFEKIFNVLLDSVAKSNDYCRNINIPPGKYDVYRKFQEWKVTQMSLMNSFDKVLAKYNLLTPKS